MNKDDLGSKLKLKKSLKKPSDSKFKQQKLPAWQPILTAQSVLPLLFAVSVSFIPLGIAFLLVTSAVKEKIVDYTSCYSTEQNMTCADYINNSTTTCKCTVTFTLDYDFPAPVFLYYNLKNFYQNHRRYVKSRDDSQLLGGDVQTMATECDPFGKDPKTKMSYAPCGAIANSLFNDSFGLTFIGGKQSSSTSSSSSSSSSVITNQKVGLIKHNIAWDTDRNSKFKNPSGFINATILGPVFNNSVKPVNWQRNVYELDPDDPSNNGYNNEDLMVWMRVAAFPSFRKLYRRINHTGLFANGLVAGNYAFDIQYNYPVTKFNGLKKLVLTTTSFLGGKNSFLGIAYLVVGCLSFFIGIIFLIIHLRIGKKTHGSLQVPLNKHTPYFDTTLADRVKMKLDNY